MAEFLLTFAVEETLKKAGSFAVDEIGRAWGLPRELDRLTNISDMIREVLNDAAEIQSEKPDVRKLLMKLQDLALYAEDVMDEFAYETLRKSLEVQTIKRKVGNFFSLSKNPIAFRFVMSRKVKKINDLLHEIQSQGNLRLVLTSIATPAGRSGAHHTSMPNRETISHLDDPTEVVEREEDVSVIIKKLLINPSSNEKLVIVPIWGMAGLGKTTLAQLVYQEAVKQNLFDKTIWIYVSENFVEKKILLGMLQDLNSSTGQIENMDTILKNLKKELKEKKFLLVLDDMWQDNIEICAKFKNNLQCICDDSRRGNAVVVTTRSKDVASRMETSPEATLELKGLLDEQCWSIISERAFGGVEGSMISMELEEIGKEIARKCGGVPLAAKVLGGMLSKKFEKEEWLSIRESKELQLIQQDKNIQALLKLSYDYLPLSLKRCFAYCSIFPKGFEVEKNNLIQLWMAEGLLEPSKWDNSGDIEDRVDSSMRSGAEMEDIGDEYFNVLIVNSFLQHSRTLKYASPGGVTYCKMHDLLLDLALSVTQSTTQKIFVDNSSSDITNLHRLNIISGGIPPSIVSKGNARRLRCLFSSVDIRHEVSSFKRLRTLNFQGVRTEELPVSISKLKHLRYLNVSMLHFFVTLTLPKSITKLYNLQTLRMTGGKVSEHLHNTDMSNLRSLRHIYFDDDKHMPFKVGCLTNLRTLPLFIVNPEPGYSIGELEHLNELRGALWIKNLESARNGDEAKRAKLNKKKISKLTLQWGLDSREDSYKEHEDVLEGLQPPTTLQSLEITEYVGKQIPSWMLINSLSLLNDLVELKLMRCRECEVIPTLGHLPKLQFLEIQSMENVTKISVEFYGENIRSPSFPALKKFSLHGMLNLVEWVAPTGVERSVFPQLEELSINDCPSLTSIPMSYFSLYKLVKLKLNNFDKCEVIPTLGHLPHLQTLKISKMPELKSIGVEFYGECNNIGSGWRESMSQSLFPMLKEFTLSDMKSLVDWVAPKVVSDQTSIFPCLENLTLKSCDCLTSFPMSHLSSLVFLKIDGCGGWTCLPDEFYRFKSLQFLRIGACENLVSIPNVKSLTSLKGLYVSNCKSLICIPKDVRELTSLFDLEIVDCMSLRHFPEDIFCRFSQLKYLRIGGFSKELEDFSGFDSIQHLSASLNYLNIEGLDEKDLPCQLQHLTTLISLKICNFRKMETLPEWLGNLSSLQRLHIMNCEKLKCLPTSIQRLSNLEILIISNSPLLRERYKKDSGPDWPNISHIPHIMIKNSPFNI